MECYHKKNKIKINFIIIVLIQIVNNCNILIIKNDIVLFKV
jgi:hypothetical protein